jgi:hypothetical protein
MMPYNNFKEVAESKKEKIQKGMIFSINVIN